MENITIEELRLAATVMRRDAAVIVRVYALQHAPDVPTATVDAICGALGDISIDEAIDVLERIQRTGE
jgi:hypothetical protein